MFHSRVVSCCECVFVSATHRRCVSLCVVETCTSPECRALGHAGRCLHPQLAGYLVVERRPETGRHLQGYMHGSTNSFESCFGPSLEGAAKNRADWAVPGRVVARVVSDEIRRLTTASDPYPLRRSRARRRARSLMPPLILPPDGALHGAVAAPPVCVRPDEVSPAVWEPRCRWRFVTRAPRPPPRPRCRDADLLVVRGSAANRRAPPPPPAATVARGRSHNTAARSEDVVSQFLFGLVSVVVVVVEVCLRCMGVCMHVCLRTCDFMCLRCFVCMYVCVCVRVWSPGAVVFILCVSVCVCVTSPFCGFC